MDFEVETALTGSRRQARFLFRLTAAVGVRSADRPTASQVHQVLQAVHDGQPLDAVGLSILRRALQDAEPWDLRAYWYTDARAAGFLRNAFAALPALRRRIYSIAIQTEVGPEVIG